MLLNCINECVNILYGNDIALVRSSDVHDVLSKDGHSFEYINIMIEDCYVKRILDYIDSDLYERFKSEKYLQYSFPKEFILEIEEVIKRADVTESDKERQILLKPLILKLFAEFVSRINGGNLPEKDQIVSRAIKLMQKNIHLDIKTLSKEMNYSQGYLTRCFNKICHMSPNKIFQQIKLNYARNLLETTDMSIESIAQEIGMSGIGYFNKMYTEQFGILPSEYKRKVKKNAEANRQIESLL